MPGQPALYPTRATPATNRIILERTTAATTELLISVDGARAVLTRRTLRRDDPLDLPVVVQLPLPVDKLGEIIAALQAAARAAGGDDA